MCRCSARRGAIRRIVARETRNCTIRVRRRGEKGWRELGRGRERVF